jgi:uncharacterized protein (TIGR02996 family)
MTDERAFLAAIKAAPADDAPRLVYADWLDEHGRHEQAEIIRVEQTYRRTRARLAELQERVDAAWAFAVFPTCHFVLYWYPREQKIAVIKLIRELLGCGLAEAKRIAETLPAELGPPTPLSALKAYVPRFQECSASVQLHLAAV